MEIIKTYTAEIALRALANEIYSDEMSDIIGGNYELLTEKLAEQVHEVWAQGRISEGWTYGTERDDENKKTPCLVPYNELPENEKEYDRNTAIQTLKFIVKMGYDIRNN